MIAKDQALESLSRFVGGHLKTDKRPTVSMPRRPTDDDAVVTGYIEQLEAENKLLRQQREAHLGVILRAKACFVCGDRVLKAGK